MMFSFFLWLGCAGSTVVFWLCQWPFLRKVSACASVRVLFAMALSAGILCRSAVHSPRLLSLRPLLCCSGLQMHVPVYCPQPRSAILFELPAFGYTGSTAVSRRLLPLLWQFSALCLSASFHLSWPSQQHFCTGLRFHSPCILLLCAAMERSMFFCLQVAHVAFSGAIHGALHEFASASMFCGATDYCSAVY